MAQIRAVLFDKDGTLFDFQKTWGAWAQGFVTSLAAGDFMLARTLCEVLGFDAATNRFHPQSPVIAGAADTSARLVAPFFPALSLEDLVEQVEESSAAATLVPAADLLPLMQKLRAEGFALGLATNDSEAAARRHLAGENILQCFDFVAGYDSGFGAKPDPEMLLAFAAKLQLHPSEVLMVGDTLHDLEAARRAGMPAVAVLCGVAEAPELAPHAEAVLETVADLPSWLAQRGSAGLSNSA